MAITVPILTPIPGYVEVEYGDERVYKRISDSRLFYPDMTPIVPYTPSEKREIAYESDPIILYNERHLTVDEAEKLFWQYFPEKSSKCDVLSDLIAEAKATIREMYPDEE